MSNMQARQATIHRKTSETDIELFLCLDGEGIVIAKKHGGLEETFTVRRLAYGVGVEKVFPIHSPLIEKVETVRSGFVRRAKLYYLRDRLGKAAKVKARV